jgi:hypothetical protein
LKESGGIKMNTEKLEGKVVDFVDRDGEHENGLVVGCEFDIGITVVNEDNHDDFLYCLIGPSSSVAKDMREKFGDEAMDDGYSKYKRMFDNAAQQIATGTLDASELIRSNPSSHGSQPSAETCPFGQ